MKDMGDLHYYLGVKVEQHKGQKSVGMDQEQCILKLMDKYGLSQAKNAATPFDCGTKLSNEIGESREADRMLYQSMVGSLMYMYIANASRPDISYAVGVVSRYCLAQSHPHMNTVKQIFCCLKKTSNLCLTFQKQSQSSLTGFSDAD
uniref:Reverse transcriptase Ty1/copia-type domain-containing protein n=1 Tax=Amphimedon queenslandica TaxID=400682 RepID=A0A1X7UUP1_AMPQE